MDKISLAFHANGENAPCFFLCEDPDRDYSVKKTVHFPGTVESLELWGYDHRIHYRELVWTVDWLEDEEFTLIVDFNPRKGEGKISYPSEHLNWHFQYAPPKYDSDEPAAEAPAQAPPAPMSPAIMVQRLQKLPLHQDDVAELAQLLWYHLKFEADTGLTLLLLNAPDDLSAVRLALAEAVPQWMVLEYSAGGQELEPLLSAQRDNTILLIRTGLNVSSIYWSKTKSRQQEEISSLVSGAYPDAAIDPKVRTLVFHP